MRLPADTVSVSVEPAAEPLTTAEAKEHLRVTGTSEDTTIDRLITVARRECEKISHRKFINQTLTGTLTDWPGDGLIRLPYPPLVSVTSIAYVDSDGNTSTVSTSVYGVDTSLGLIYLDQDQEWPTAVLRDYRPITVTWVAGYGTAGSDVPAEYRQAILLLLGHLYENREAVLVGAGLTVTALALGLDSLLMTDRGYV